MSDHRDREALEFFFGNGSNMPPDTSISDLAKQLGTPGAVVYEGEVTPPPPNPHREADELAAEAAKKARVELATAQRAAAAGAAAEAVRNGATPEQAQIAAREAVAALQREADDKAAQYASTHPPTPPAPAGGQPVGTGGADEVEAFNAAMGIGTAPAAPAEVPTFNYGNLPSVVRPLAQAMSNARLDPSEHLDLLDTAARIASASIIGTLTDADVAAADDVNKQLGQLGLDPYFS